MTTKAKQTTNRTSAVDAVTAPADKPTESKAAKVSRSAPLDLTALSVEATVAPKVKGNPAAGRKKQDNSVAENWLRDSWDAREGDSKMGGGRAVTVPTAAVGTLKSRLNMAAATLSLGVAIQTEEIGDNTRVVFAAKVRKQKRTTKPTEATANA